MKRSMTFGFNYSLLLVVISTDIGQDCSPIARYLFIFEIIDLILPNRQVTKLLSGGSRISQGTPTPERGAPTYYFANFLPKNYMKMNESGPRGGAHPWRPPDPPLLPEQEYPTPRQNNIEENSFLIYVARKAFDPREDASHLFLLSGLGYETSDNCPCSLLFFSGQVEYIARICQV